MTSQVMESTPPLGHRGVMTSTLHQLGAVVDAKTPVRSAAQPVRNTLRLNAVTSAGGVLALVVAAGPMNDLLGTGSPSWVRIVGAGLFVFALDVGYLSGTSIRRLVRFTPFVSIGDGIWVLASIATMAAGWYSAPGNVIVGAVACMVGIFGVRQLVLVRRLHGASHGIPADALDEVPPTEVCHVESTIDTTPAIAWSVITDHALYGRLAPNLSRVAPTAPDGPGLTRTCANRGGDEWNETCTVWDEGHQYEIAVDTSNYPYPLAEMRGSWSTGVTSPAVVRMDFRYRPLPGIRGRLFAAAMQAAFPMVLGRIIRGWRRAASERAATD